MHRRTIHIGAFRQKIITANIFARWQRNENYTRFTRQLQNAVLECFIFKRYNKVTISPYYHLYWIQILWQFAYYYPQKVSSSTVMLTKLAVWRHNVNQRIVQRNRNLWFFYVCCLSSLMWNRLPFKGFKNSNLRNMLRILGKAGFI